MRGMKLALLGALAFVAGASAQGQAPLWSPQPWLEDLAQMRAALDEKYANLEWLRDERALDLDALFRRAGDALRGARSDAEARAIFDRVVQRIGDGHVEINWPRPAPAAPASSPASPTAAPVPATAVTPAQFCRRLGYNAAQNRAGVGPSLSGYRALPGANLFPAGLIRVANVPVGVLRIGIFQPQGFPAACEQAVAELRTPLDRPCDESCDNAVLTAAYRRLNRDLQGRLAELKAAGAQALLIDISDNGGGSEWAEAVARMVTPRRLVAERIGFVRGAHWAAHWRRLAEGLREAARTASGAERARLLGLAAEADAALKEAEKVCTTAAPCPRLGRAGYATGLIGEAPAGALAGRDWAAYVFSPAQYKYRDGAWSGPLIVLVDQETWSAAEEFAATLQDNQAAMVIGARTGGAGCGHTDGGTPTILAHSGATLQVPDCVRFRRDGSNEVSGILPDIPLAIRANDGPRFKARLIEAALPTAVAAAMVGDAAERAVRRKR